jgi:hypothetical protein
MAPRRGNTGKVVIASAWGSDDLGSNPVTVFF